MKNLSKTSPLKGIRRLSPIGAALAVCLAAHAAHAQDAAPTQKAAAKATARAAFITRLDPAREHALPLVFDSDHGFLPIIPVSINGAEPMYFVVDTGAPGGMYLEPWAAQRLKLALKPSGKAIETFMDDDQAAAVSAHMADLSKIEFVERNARRLALGKATAIVVGTKALESLSQSPKIAGVVGAKMLQSMTLRFDFVSKTLFLTTDHHPPLRIPGASNVPMEHDPSDTQRKVTVNLNGLRLGGMILDTGYTSVRIPSLLAYYLSDIKISREIYTATDFASKTFTVPILVSKCRIGDYDEPDVEASVTRILGLPLLGIDFLSRFMVTIDYPNDQMTLQRASNYAQVARVRGDVGFSITKRGANIIAATVDLEAAPYVQGVRPADSIVSVNGVPTKGKTVDEVRDMLYRAAGSTVKIVLRRSASAPYTITVPCVSRFVSADETQKFGFDVSPKMENERIRVLTIDRITPGSPSEKAGLLAGDEIVRINGAVVSGMSIREVPAAMTNPRIKNSVLTIRRAKKPDLIEVRIEATRSPLRDLFRP